jgi:[ribosomal protein S5]-alanine N-acetyltransferase
VQFRSERLEYREFTENDFNLFYSVFSNEHVMKYAYLDKFSCEEDLFPNFMNLLKNNSTSENRKAFEFGVFLSSNNNFIGFADIEVRNMNDFGGCGEIGYFILQSFWGNGYGSEIADSLIEFCFKQLNMHRVSAKCNSNNLQSEKFMKKAGMIKEGEFRKIRFKNNQWENEQNYSILIEEWEERNKKESKIIIL